MPNPDINAFDAILARLSEILEQLARVHQKEVQDARCENLERQNKPNPQAVLSLGSCPPDGGLQPPMASEVIPVTVPGGFPTEIPDEPAALLPLEKNSVATLSELSSPRYSVASSPPESPVSPRVRAKEVESLVPGPKASRRNQSESLSARASKAGARVKLAPMLSDASDLPSDEGEEDKADDGFRASRSQSKSTWMQKQLTMGAHTSMGKQASVFRQYQIRAAWQEKKEESHMSLVEMISQEGDSGAMDKLEKRATLVTAGVSSKTMALSERYNDRNRSRIVLHPESKGRTTWVLLCMVFLLHDLMVVPFEVCFEPEPTSFSNAMDFISMLFWTIDIPLNFCTGVQTMEGLDMRLGTIARSYIRSWFFFDVLIIAPEWLTFLMGDENFPSGSHVAFFRFMRWARLTRLLRLARVVRGAKVKMLIRRIAFAFHLSKLYVLATQGWVGLSLLLLVIVHLISCFWYAFGISFEDGWINSNTLETKDLGYLYIVSVHWSFCRLHGMMSYYRLETTWELLMDALLIYLMLGLAALYISSAVVVSMTGKTSKTTELWNVGIEYVRRHGISSELSFRMQKMLEASQYAGPGEIAQEEEKLLQALPITLQSDLKYEARKRVVCAHSTFFSDLVVFNRQAVVHICNNAIAAVVAVKAEVLFTYSDACTRMIFIDSGKLVYFLGRNDCYVNRSSQIQVRNSSMINKLKHGACISEPTLWTTWEHMGSLAVTEEAMLLCADANDFAQVILQHKGPRLHAVRYAKHFLWNLNQTSYPNDLTSFPELTIESIDTELFDGGEEDHFIFLSHYKVESGTEATLMRDLLQDLLIEDRSHPANNLQSPIFIDSEDLSDLARLKEHVIGSACLVLLLTPGVLSRPWCLIEIVTAIRHMVPIVPVEVQRPGCSYNYPNEDFYKSILAGRLVSQQGTELLAQEGVQLVDVEKAIRQVFLKIAISFSPHKTKTIREAELRDILKRCNEEITSANQNLPITLG